MCLHCNLTSPTVCQSLLKKVKKKIHFLCLDQAQCSQNSSHLTCQQSITTISLLMLAEYCHLQSLFMGGRWKSWHFAMWLSNTLKKKSSRTAACLGNSISHNHLLQAEMSVAERESVHSNKNTDCCSIKSTDPAIPYSETLFYLSPSQSLSTWIKPVALFLSNTSSIKVSINLSNVPLN